MFSLDLRSSKKDTQEIIQQWISKNYRYNHKSWEIDILAKRIIAWISNARLTYEDGTSSYKDNFNGVIKKQINYARDHTVRDSLDFHAVWNAGLISGKDMQEAMKAYVNKTNGEYDDLEPKKSFWEKEGLI